MAQPCHVQHLPEVVIRVLQVCCGEEDRSKIGDQVPLIEPRVVGDDCRNIAGNLSTQHPDLLVGSSPASGASRVIAPGER